MDAQTQLELEAAAFRTLRDHLQKRTDVQNIDMMNLAGFCRNCLSRWYQEAAVRSAKWRRARRFTGCPLTSGKQSIRRRPATHRKLPSRSHMMTNADTGVTGCS